jgi:hypothetical protein
MSLCLKVGRNANVLYVRYPGPVLARVSRLWAARQVGKQRQHHLSHELFEKYKSDVVRTGW